jgi:hypothetical protein
LVEQDAGRVTQEGRFVFGHQSFEGRKLLGLELSGGSLHACPKGGTRVGGGTLAAIGTNART